MGKEFTNQQLQDWARLSDLHNKVWQLAIDRMKHANDYDRQVFLDRLELFYVWEKHNAGERV